MNSPNARLQINEDKVTSSPRSVLLMANVFLLYQQAGKG
jgi:hypothetical protein